MRASARLLLATLLLGTIPAGSTGLAATSVSTATLSMPDTASAGPGAVVQVPISVVPGDGIFGIDMTVTYATGVLQAQSVTVSGIGAAQGFGLAANLNTQGVIVISMYATQNALSGSGEIARIQFLVVGSVGATSNLTFTGASINENGISAVLDPGLFTVTCAGASDGTPCNDGNSCTTNDSCHAGICSGVGLQVPAEIANVRIAADRSTISWDSAGGSGPGTVHDVLRGLESQLPVGAGAGETCLASGIVSATVVDTAIPSAMSCYWYLVRGRNACGTGTYGFQGINGAPGPERISTVCP